jgi:hypothetical protein
MRGDQEDPKEGHKDFEVKGLGALMNIKDIADELLTEPSLSAHGWLSEFGTGLYYPLIEILYRLMIEGMPLPDKLVYAIDDQRRLVPELIWGKVFEYFAIKLIDETRYAITTPYCGMYCGYRYDEPVTVPLGRLVNDVCAVLKARHGEQIKILRSEV